MINFELLESKIFLLILTIFPIIFGASIIYLSNRLELMKAFYTPERVNTAYFNDKKQQLFFNKYKNRLDERHLNLLNNKFIQKRAIKILDSTLS